MIVNLAGLRQQRTFPPQPELDPAHPRRRNPLSLEQQKKRAKDLLHAFRSNDGNAIARFQLHSPECLTGDRGARLHDAQQVVARENGFRKWTDLKAHIDRIAIEQRATLEGRPTALDGTDRTLHIRCGQDIMHDLALAGFNGDFLSFSDPYIDGPVPRTESLEEFVRIRAYHLEQGAHRESFDELFGSYRDLERSREYPVVHIWMEHDLYDQLILSRLLYFFSDVSARPKRLRMINVTHFPGVEPFVGLGQLPPQALRLLWEEFEDVTKAQLVLGKQVWDAITSPSPDALMQIAKAGTPAIPTMGSALTRHIRELPSVRNGLSMAEELTLQVLADKGTMTAARVFGSYMSREACPFMGDTSFWKLLSRLSSSDEPALSVDGRRANPEEVNPTSKVDILPFGERLLRSEADWLKANPAGRWVGGVRIDPQETLNWRFDEDRGTVCRQ
jgi:hypothetical protein